ncbi:class II fructose-bisphosphate aldolase [Bacillus sp. WP8]|uniref:class II fructose-bisphosphate aldolase n=1 Tax=Bacillus sp. WP8 TaxID=756828 RepID=UPI0021B4F69D|nr:class II fructose-bisphosphate aldolase [Bacillus sp. WP8]
MMMDGCEQGFDENVERSGKVVEVGHLDGVCVDGEVGSVGGEEDEVMGEGVIYGDGKEWEEVVEGSGIEWVGGGLG